VTGPGTFGIAVAETATCTGDLAGNVLSAVNDAGNCVTTPLTQETTVPGLHVTT
jgi:hypothetical protein